MELIIGLVAVAVVVYFVAFRKKEEASVAPVATVTVDDVVATAEVVDAKPAKKAPAKKPAAKKPAAKKAPAKKAAKPKSK